MRMHYKKKNPKICTLKSQHNYYRNANQNYQTQDGYKVTAQIQSISKNVEKSGAQYISGEIIKWCMDSHSGAYYRGSTIN